MFIGTFCYVGGSFRLWSEVVIQLATTLAEEREAQVKLQRTGIGHRHVQRRKAILCRQYDQMNREDPNDCKNIPRMEPDLFEEIADRVSTTIKSRTSTNVITRLFYFWLLLLSRWADWSETWCRWSEELVVSSLFKSGHLGKSIIFLTWDSWNIYIYWKTSTTPPPMARSNTFLSPRKFFL